MNGGLIKTKVTLLSSLESKNKQKWINLYEDKSFKETTYYYTMYNGGGNMGAITLKQAAQKVCDIAATMGRLYRIDISNNQSD